MQCKPIYLALLPRTTRSVLNGLCMRELLLHEKATTPQKHYERYAVSLSFCVTHLWQKINRVWSPRRKFWVGPRSDSDALEEVIMDCLRERKSSSISGNRFQR